MATTEATLTICYQTRDTRADELAASIRAEGHAIEERAATRGDRNFATSCPERRLMAIANFYEISLRGWHTLHVAGTR